MPVSAGPTTPQQRAVWPLPLALTLVFVALSFTRHVQENPVLVRTFWASAAVLLIWQIVLFRSSRSRRLHFDVALHKHHYIQAFLQVVIFAYWGWYWREIYRAADLIIAQLVFSYVFDMLLCWTRRDRWLLGFGPVPITFSINIFLWFKDDWFYWQFLMVAVAFAAKEFLKWNREGTRTHIFNPSAFALVLFSLVLIATGTSEMTWGVQNAATLHLAPNVYLFLFFIGMVVMYFFSVTLVAALAGAVLFGLSALYYQVVGVPYFVDSEIPAAVFLGLHLLITDPSTSPRSPAGRAIFGVLYGFGVFALYEVLGAFGVPTFYDKLLCVPLLNLGVQRIDGMVGSARWRWVSERLSFGWAPARANLVHIGVWALFFGAITAIGSTDATHPGDSVPFWQEACEDGRRNACTALMRIESNYCDGGSGWACNEVGLHYREGIIVEADPDLAVDYLSLSCARGFQPGCLNAVFTEPVPGRPEVSDLRIILREARANLTDMPETELLERACAHGWMFACEADSGEN